MLRQRTEGFCRASTTDTEDNCGVDAPRHSNLARIQDSVAPTTENWWVALFGIAAAILAPVGLNVLTAVLRSPQDEALRRLAKAGDLERRIAEADTMEQKIDALRSERKRLDQVVVFEAHRLALENREDALHEEAARLAQDVERIGRELAGINEERRRLGENVESSAVYDEVRALHGRLHSYSKGEPPPGPGGLRFLLKPSG
jgi:hypothetical protein